MTDEQLRSAFENYLNAFATTSLSEQKHLLETSVSETVVFANPGVEGNGHSDLLAHIAAFQARFPGSTFRVNWFVQQHGQALAEWTQLDEHGSECVTAHSYAMFDPEGRVARWAGFWKPGAVQRVYSAPQEH